MRASDSFVLIRRMSVRMVHFVSNGFSGVTSRAAAAAKVLACASTMSCALASCGGTGVVGFAWGCWLLVASARFGVPLVLLAAELGCVDSTGAAETSRVGSLLMSTGAAVASTGVPASTVAGVTAAVSPVSLEMDA